jgi:riboflavin kinase
LKTHWQTYFILKELKQLAGSGSEIEISSSDLAEKLEVSQQSASNYIIELSESGYIERKMASRRQSISITEKGLNFLYRELDSLSNLLETEKSIVIKGSVTSGLGEGRYYVSRKNYVIQFQKKLNFIPYLGTLNIAVEPDYRSNYSRVKSAEGIHIEGFKTEDRTFGPVKAFRAKIFNTDCAIIMPERTVHSDIVEVICTDYLRGKYSLKDGDRVSLTVQIRN